VDSTKAELVAKVDVANGEIDGDVGMLTQGIAHLMTFLKEQNGDLVEDDEDSVGSSQTFYDADMAIDAISDFIEKSERRGSIVGGQGQLALASTPTKVVGIRQQYAIEWSGDKDQTWETEEFLAKLPCGDTIEKLVHDFQLQAGRDGSIEGLLGSRGRKKKLPQLWVFTHRVHEVAYKARIPNATHGKSVKDCADRNGFNAKRLTNQAIWDDVENALEPDEGGSPAIIAASIVDNSASLMARQREQAPLELALHKLNNELMARRREQAPLELASADGGASAASASGGVASAAGGALELAETLSRIERARVELKQVQNEEAKIKSNIVQMRYRARESRDMLSDTFKRVGGESSVTCDLCDEPREWHEVELAHIIGAKVLEDQLGLQRPVTMGMFRKQKEFFTLTCRGCNSEQTGTVLAESDHLYRFKEHYGGEVTQEQKKRWEEADARFVALKKCYENQIARERHSEATGVDDIHDEDELEQAGGGTHAHRVARREKPATETQPSYTRKRNVLDGSKRGGRR